MREPGTGRGDPLGIAAGFGDRYNGPSRRRPVIHDQYSFLPPDADQQQMMTSARTAMDMITERLRNGKARSLSLSTSPTAAPAFPLLEWILCFKHRFPPERPLMRFI